MNLRMYWMLTAGLLALAACGGSGDKEGGNASADASAAGGSGSSGGSVAGGDASVQLDPGEWETVVEMTKIEGLPKEAAGMFGGGKKVTTRYCVTPEDARETNPKLFTGKDNCERKDFSVSGGRIRGTLSCSGGDMPGKVTMAMEGEYASTSYDVRQTMTTEAQGMTMRMESHVTGRRLGECSAETKKS
jgi:Protein of unknown function (DUF3617)